MTKYIKIEPPSHRYRPEDVFYVKLADCPIDGISLEDWLDKSEPFNMEDVINERIATCHREDYGKTDEEATQAIINEVGEEFVELLNLVQPHLNGAEPSAESTFSLVTEKDEDQE